jgi:hypothetical protein
MKNQDASTWMQHSHQTIFFIQKIKQWFFSYTRFPVNKINVEKTFKIMRKLLFIYSFYSHPKIGKFEGVTWSLARTVVWLGWWRGGRRRKVKTKVVFISSVQGTQWVVCCVSQIWVRVLMCFWFYSTPRIVDFIVSTGSITRCWRTLASLFFDRRTG